LELVVLAICLVVLTHRWYSHAVAASDERQRARSRNDERRSLLVEDVDQVGGAL